MDRNAWRIGVLTGIVVFALLSGIAGAAHSSPGTSGHGRAGSGRSGARPAVEPLASFGLGTNGATPSAIALNWTATNALFFSNYTIEVSTNGSGGPWQSVGVITSQSTSSFVVTGLSPGSTYSWQVVEAGFGSTQSSTVLTFTQPPLALLNVTLLSGTSAQFNWTNNATYGGPIAFVAYDLFESLAGSPGTPVAHFAQSTANSTVVTGLSPGSSYLFYLATTDCDANCGTANPTILVSQSNVVTVGAPMPLVASISADRSVIDTGEAEYLTCTPSGGTSPFTFSWDLGNGTFVPGAPSVGYRFSTPGNVTVRCEVQDSTRGSSVAATQLSVYPAPSVSLTLDRTQLDVGENAQFGCRVSGGDPPFALTLTYGDGAGIGFANGTFVDHAYPQPGAYTPTCLVTDGAGATRLDSLLVEVSPDPTLTLSASSTAAAPGTPLHFNGTGLNGSGNFTGYSWSFGDGTPNATGPSAAHAFPAAGRYPVELSARDSNGISVARTQWVNISPIQVSVVAPGPTFEQGTDLPFSASAVGGAGGPYNFTWSFGDGTVAFGPVVHHLFRSAGVESYALTVTDRLGAVVSPPAGHVTLTVPPAPIIPTPAPWFLLLGATAGLFVTFVSYRAERRRADGEADPVAGYVPVVDPNRSLQGIKVCGNCGATNVPVRRVCETCGTRLRRSPGRSA